MQYITRLAEQAGYLTDKRYGFKTSDPTQPLFWSIDWYPDDYGHFISLGIWTANGYQEDTPRITGFSSPDFVLTQDGVVQAPVLGFCDNPDHFWNRDCAEALKVGLRTVVEEWGSVWTNPEILIGYYLALEGEGPLPVAIAQLPDFDTHRLPSHRHYLADLYGMTGDFDAALRWAEKIDTHCSYQELLISDLREGHYRKLACGDVLENDFASKPGHLVKYLLTADLRQLNRSFQHLSKHPLGTLPAGGSSENPGRGN